MSADRERERKYLRNGHPGADRFDQRQVNVGDSNSRGESV